MERGLNLEGKIPPHTRPSRGPPASSAPGSTRGSLACSLPSVPAHICPGTPPAGRSSALLCSLPTWPRCSPSLSHCVSVTPTGVAVLRLLGILLPDALWAGPRVPPCAGPHIPHGSSAWCARATCGLEASMARNLLLWLRPSLRPLRLPQTQRLHSAVGHPPSHSESPPHVLSH